MYFYLFLLLSSTILVFFSQYAERKIYINLCVMVTLILGVIASLRGLVGTDTFSYHLQFQLIKSFELFDKDSLTIEPAFVAIAKLVELSGGDSFAYISFVGILQTLLLIYLLRRLESPALFLIYYIATFYIIFHFNIIREATSLLLLMISLTWIKEGGRMFFTTLLASLFFHYTAILFIPYMLLYKQFKDRKYVSLMWLIPMILAVIFGVLTLFRDVLNAKYEGYSNEEGLEATRGIGMGLLLQLFLYAGLGVTLFKRGKIDLIFFVLPVILIKILIVRYPLLMRLEMFFNISLLCLLTKDAVEGWQRELSGVILVALSLLNIYGTINYISNENAQMTDLAHSLSPYIPYHTMFVEKR